MSTTLSSRSRSASAASAPARATRARVSSRARAPAGRPAGSTRPAAASAACQPAGSSGRARAWLSKVVASPRTRSAAASRACRCWSRYAPPRPPSIVIASSEAASATASRRRFRSSTARASATARSRSADRNRSCTPARYAVSRPLTAPASRGRSCGSRARQSLARATSSGSDPLASSRDSDSVRSPSAALRWISPDERPVNAGRPVRTSQRIDPSAMTSARSSTRSISPRACSGAMYDGVPSTEPACDKSESPDPLRAVAITVSSRGGFPAVASSATPPQGNTFASPQSMTWTSPNEPTMTFDGFRSRWITPRACA